MIRRLCLIIISSVIFVSCIELMMHHPDNEIVVIGNGLDGGHLLVADIKNGDQLESLVVQNNGFVPVRARFQAYDAVVEEETPSKLEWVTKDEKGNRVLRIRSLVESARQCPYLQTSESEESVCRFDLEQLLISDEHEPVFLKEDRIVFIDVAKNLVFYDGLSSIEILMTDVEEFFVGKNDIIFFSNSQDEWFYLKEDRVVRISPDVTIHFAYLSDDKDFYLYTGEESSQLYRFDMAKLDLEPVWTQDIAQREIKSHQVDAVAFVRQDRLYTLATIKSESGLEESGVLVISPDEFRFTPFNEELLNLSVGKKKFLVEYENEEAQSEFIVCTQIGNPGVEMDQLCEAFLDPQGYRLMKALLGPQDQVFAAAEKLTLLRPDGFSLVDRKVAAAKKFEVLELESDEAKGWKIVEHFPIEGNIDNIRLFTR